MFNLNDFINNYIVDQDGRVFPKRQPLPTQGPEAVKMAMQMVPIAGVKELMPFQAAQPAARIGQAFDITGNMSIDDTYEILKIARQYLKIPQKTLSKLPISRIISELRGMITPEQSKIIGR